MKYEWNRDSCKTGWRSLRKRIPLLEFSTLHKDYIKFLSRIRKGYLNCCERVVCVCGVGGGVRWGGWGRLELLSVLWNGVEYLEGWSKLDLEYIDNVILSQQEKRFTVNLLKGNSGKSSFNCFHHDTFRYNLGQISEPQTTLSESQLVKKKWFTCIKLKQGSDMQRLFDNETTFGWCCWNVCITDYSPLKALRTVTENFHFLPGVIQQLKFLLSIAD